MRDRLEEIVDFTELGYYIDMPVRTYSAGMVIPSLLRGRHGVSPGDSVDG